MRTIVTVALALLAGGEAAAQQPAAWPSRPLRIIMPLVVGGPGDIHARAIAHKLTEALGQNVIVENRPGAGSNIGFEAAAKASPDGYTILVAPTPFTINPALFARVPYDPVRDFAPVTRIATFPLVLAVIPSLPVSNTKEFIEYVRARPGQVHFGSSGNGSSLHLAGELMNTMAGIKLVHVPYKGVPEAVNDMIGGRIPAGFPGTTIALPHIKAGRIKALAVTGLRRTAGAPEIPTVHETGLPGFDVIAWYGALMPAGTPRAIIERLHAELGRALQSQEIQSRWQVLGADIVFDTPAEFATFIRTELDKWSKVVKASGAKVD